MKLCTAPDCYSKYWARGYCRNHYREARLHGRFILEPSKIKTAPTAEYNWAQNIEACREVKGLSRQALAKKAGIAEHTLQRMLSGSGEPSIHKVDFVAQALGLQLWEICLPPEKFDALD